MKLENAIPMFYLFPLISRHYIFPRGFHSEPVLFDFPAALPLFALLIVYVVLGSCYYLGTHVLK